MMSAGKKLGPRGRADRTHIKTIKARAVPLQRINMRGAEIDIPGAGELSPSLVISEEHQNIWRRTHGRENSHSGEN